MASERPAPGFTPALVVVDMQEDFCPPVCACTVVVLCGPEFLTMATCRVDQWLSKELGPCQA